LFLYLYHNNAQESKENTVHAIAPLADTGQAGFRLETGCFRGKEKLLDKACAKNGIKYNGKTNIRLRPCGVLLPEITTMNEEYCVADLRARG
jgi:hypothetical protein